MIFLLIASLSDAHADPNDCTTSFSSYANTDGLRPYRYNPTNMGDFDLDIERTIGATALAAGVWNEQANAGHWRGVGTTLDTGLPFHLSDCQAAAKEFTLILFNSTGWSADEVRVSGRCFDASGQAHHAVITLFLRDGSGVVRDWGNGAVAGPDFDVPGAIVKGLGVALGLGFPESHPDWDPAVDDWAAAMRRDHFGALHRDLFQWDLKCSEEVSGRRTVEAVSRIHSGTSGFAAATVMDVAGTKAGSGLTWDSGWYWATSRHRANGTHQWYGPGPSWQTVPIESTTGIGFVPALWREHLNVDRIFFSEWADWPTPFEWTSRHRVQQRVSGNSFVGSSSTPLRHCFAFSSFMNCTSSTVAYSRGVATTSFLGTPYNMSVVAWLHQDHSGLNNTPASNEVWVSIGTTSTHVLSQPEATGIRSAVPPGLACWVNFAGDYDCLLVYVPIDDLASRVFATRFKVVLGATHYELELDPSGPYPLLGNTRTGEAIAAWYIAGAETGNGFYVAYRTANVNQQLEVQTSLLGTSWSIVSTGLDLAVGLPNAASEWRGTTNRLIYTR